MVMSWSRRTLGAGAAALVLGVVALAPALAAGYGTVTSNAPLSCGTKCTEAGATYVGTISPTATTNVQLQVQLWRCPSTFTAATYNASQCTKIASANSVTVASGKCTSHCASASVELYCSSTSSHVYFTYGVAYKYGTTTILTSSLKSAKLVGC